MTFFHFIFWWFARLELLFLDLAVENCPLGLGGVVLGLNVTTLKSGLSNWKVINHPKGNKYNIHYNR